mgnify:CR=1 FL=1
MSFLDHDARLDRANTFGGAVRYGAAPPPDKAPVAAPQTGLARALEDLMKLRLDPKLPASLTPAVDRVLMNLMAHRQTLNEGC